MTCRADRGPPATTAAPTAPGCEDPAGSGRGLSRSRPESGTSTLEFVIAFSVALFVVFAGVYFGLWWHSQHVVTAAAAEGLADARVEGGSPAAGEAKARLFLDQLAPGLLVEREVVATQSGDEVRIVVTGTVDDIVPGLRLRVRAVARGPVEQFVADP